MFSGGCSRSTPQVPELGRWSYTGLFSVFLGNWCTPDYIANLSIALADPRLLLVTGPRFYMWQRSMVNKSLGGVEDLAQW